MTANPTFWLDWNSDFIITPSGSIQTAVGWDAYRQRVVRRIISNSAQTLTDGTTTPPDYVFNPAFGVGLGAQVDAPFDADSLSTVEQKISLGVLQDPETDSAVPPNIIFQQPSVSQLNIFISVGTVSGENGTIAIGGA